VEAANSKAYYLFSEWKRHLQERANATFSDTRTEPPSDGEDSEDGPEPEDNEDPEDDNGSQPDFAKPDTESNVAEDGPEPEDNEDPEDDNGAQPDLAEPDTESNVAGQPPWQVQAELEVVEPVPIPAEISTASTGPEETSVQVTNEGDLAKGKQRRIGIDIGGVLTRDGGDQTRDRSGDWGSDWEAPGAFEGVRQLVGVFGPSNVFLVSKASEDMQRQTKHWLDQTKFCEVTGVPPKNIEFVRSRDGPEGKGEVASKLGLSHFVDDNFQCLKSVFCDKDGNSGDVVERFKGVLVHFAKGGCGSVPPRIRESRIPDRMRDYYMPVANWADIRNKLITMPVANWADIRNKLITRKPADLHKEDTETYNASSEPPSKTAPPLPAISDALDCSTFDGDWGPASRMAARIRAGTQGVTLAFVEDASEDIRLIVKSKHRFLMTYRDRSDGHDKLFLATLQEDGSLAWSDGDVWFRHGVAKPSWARVAALPARTHVPQAKVAPTQPKRQQAQQSGVQSRIIARTAPTGLAKMPSATGSPGSRGVYQVGGSSGSGRSGAVAGNNATVKDPPRVDARSHYPPLKPTSGNACKKPGDGQGESCSPPAASYASIAMGERRTPAPEAPVHLGRMAREAAMEKGGWVRSTVPPPPPEQATVGHVAEERKVRALSKDHVRSQGRTTALAEPVHLARMARRAAPEEGGSTVPPPPPPPPQQTTVDHEADERKVRGSSKEHVRSEPIDDRQYFGTISRFSGSYGLVDCHELIKPYPKVLGVFVHINDCSTRPRKPDKWERVSFRLALKNRGEPKAVQVRMGWDDAVQDGSWKAKCSCNTMTCRCVQPKSQAADTRGSSNVSQHSSGNTQQPISGEEQTPDHVAELTKPESPRILPASWEDDEEVEHADSTVRQMPANGAVRTTDVAPDNAERDAEASTTLLPASSEGRGAEDEGGDAEADGQNLQSRQCTGARRSPSLVSVRAELEEPLDEASAGFGLPEGPTAMGKPDLGSFFQVKKKNKKKLKE